MPCTYSIDSERDVVLVQGEGILTDQELIAMSRAVSRDPKFHPNIRFFCDFTRVEKNRLSSKCLSQVPEIMRHSPKARCVILFTNKLLDIGMFRVYEAYCDIMKKGAPRGFHSREDALACLNEGLPPEKHVT